MLRRILREPLVHFLALGLLLFAVFSCVGRDDRDRRIVMGPPELAELAARHAQVWGRPPTPAEMKALISSRVDEEILYREGLAMGLDRDDALVRRRVVQKYELIAEEDEARAPSEAELSAWLTRHPDRYRQAPLVTFRQILIPAGADPSQLRTRLVAGEDPSSVGAATMLPAQGAAVSLDRVERDFGWSFADSLATLPTGRWEGPVTSEYGEHLVRISSRQPGRVPALAEIRNQVANDWEAERRRRARDARLARLRATYRVTVEG